MLGLCPIPGTELLKPLEFLSDESSRKGVFVMLTKWLLESPWVTGGWALLTRGTDQGAGGLELQGRDRGWRWNRSPVASGLVNHAYVREPL